MSFVLISPDLVSASAADLNGIGSTLTAANAAAAGPTTTVLAATIAMRCRRPSRSGSACMPGSFRRSARGRRRRHGRHRLHWWHRRPTGHWRDRQSRGSTGTNSTNGSHG
jgi:PE family